MLFISQRLQVHAEKEIILSRVWIWLQTGFGLVIGFTEPLHNVTTTDYSNNANSHTLQCNTASNMYFQSAFSGNGFQCRSFLSFHVHALTGRRLPPNYLNSRLVLRITAWHGPHRKHRVQHFFYCFSTSCRTAGAENISFQLVHWSVLGICYLTTGVVYGVIT
jgi:hypothetical protein